MRTVFRDGNPLKLSMVTVEDGSFFIQHSNNGGNFFFSGERFNNARLLLKRMDEIEPLKNWTKTNYACTGRAGTVARESEVSQPARQ